MYDEAIEKLARKLTRAGKRGSGTALSPDEVAALTNVGCLGMILKEQNRLIEKQWQERGYTKSEITGSAENPQETTCTPTGMTPLEEKEAEKAYLRRTLNKPRPHSTGGPWKGLKEIPPPKIARSG